MMTGHGNSICEMCSPAQHVEPRWRCAGLSALAVMIPVCFALLQTLAAHAQSPQTAEDVAGNDAVKAHIKSYIPSGQTVVPGEKPLSPQESLKRFTVADGLEIELVAAVPPGRGQGPSVRTFSAFTAGLHALRDWLLTCHIKTVAMESTGNYWLCACAILEDAGIEVCLVNARHVKGVPGKKTDVCDAAWLQQLHAAGLLRGSFRP